ncbi:glutaredoxin family protein [Phormidium nigroviride]
MKINKLPLCLSGILISLAAFATASAQVGAEGFPSAIAKEISRDTRPSSEQEAPPITTNSGPDEMALAAHLQSLKVKMYGAYWCPYCHAQEELFGKEAFAMIEYIECDPKGKNAQPNLCRDANITGYPTWEINGQFYRGMQFLDELANASGYRGSRNFKNTFSDPEKFK